MDDNERKIRMQELLELKNQLMDETKSSDLVKPDIQENQSSDSSNTRSKVRVLSNGKVTGVQDYQQSNNFFFDKSGTVNVLVLSIITFVFESLFLFLSFLLFK